MGLLLTVTTSQKYPQPKSTSYPNERAPLANRYNSDRPTMTTDDDYLPVAAIEPVYGTNSPGGNYNQYPNPAGGSDNDSTKYPAKDYHVPLSYCPEVGGLESHCRPAKDCAVWYSIVRTIPGTSCTLDNGQGGQGICCPNMPYNGSMQRLVCMIDSRLINQFFLHLLAGRHGATFSKPSSCPQGLQPDPHPDRITEISVKEAVELGELQISPRITPTV
jgi:hypothetical protein